MRRMQNIIRRKPIFAAGMTFPQRVLSQNFMLSRLWQGAGGFR